MLDYLQAVSLLLLIVAHAFLIRGCFGIREAIPTQGGEIASRLDGVTGLLDEVAQLLADLGDGITAGVPAPAQSPGGFGDLLSMFLTNRMNMANEHGKTQEWEIHQTNNDPTPTDEQGIEPNLNG